MTKSRHKRAIQAFEAERRRRLDQERRLRIREEEAWVSFEPPAPTPVTPSGEPMRSGRRVPGQSVECGWCGESIPIRTTGRLPKWCSRTCRQRAWEAAKAAERDERPVQVVTRYLRAVPDTPADWVIQLDHLVRQLKASSNGEWFLRRDALMTKLREAAELAEQAPLHTGQNATGWDY